MFDVQRGGSTAKEASAGNPRARSIVQLFKFILQKFDLYPQAITRRNIPEMAREKVYDIAEAGVNHRFELKCNRLVFNSNFGFLYGMQPAGYVTYAQDTYGVVVTEKQAKFQRDEFFKLFPQLLSWHNAYQAYARQHGHIRTPLGRVRHLPMIGSRDWGVKSKEERRAINAPVQATLSDLTQLAGVTVEKEYGIQDDCFPVTMTHDELVYAVRTDQLDIWVPRLVEVFENLPLGEQFGWYPKVKFIAEPEYGERLGSLQPWH